MNHILTSLLKTAKPHITYLPESALFEVGVSVKWCVSKKRCFFSYLAQKIALFRIKSYIIDDYSQKVNPFDQCFTPVFKEADLNEVEKVNYYETQCGDAVLARK